MPDLGLKTLNAVCILKAQDYSKSITSTLEWPQAYIKPLIYDGLVQDCSISIALAMEILQSCTKPSIYHIYIIYIYHIYINVCVFITNSS